MVRVIKIGFYLLCFWGNPVFGQISPGELTQTHAHLEGISNCTQCHVLGEKETTSKCLECHKEIKNLINLNKGYHSSTDVTGKKCASCHSEHFGRNFSLVKFDTITFNHKLTGFTLIGTHAELTCSKCHSVTLIEVNVSQKKGNTYLGMGTTCLSCHNDYHQQTLANECTKCHNQEKFKPATLFDHSKSKFPLLGKHQSTDCIKCHKEKNKNGEKFQEFSGITHNNCTSCHKDVHENKFGKNCTKCHSENSFREVKGLSNFDHSKTKFALRGKHQDVKCVLCHKENYTKNIRYNRCDDCHKDYHEGQLKKTGITTDCSECHTVESFKETNYTIEKHNFSGFILEGSHVATPCANCHKTKSKWKFKGLGKECVDCHINIHKNYISDKYYLNQNCTKCHITESWVNTKFDHSLTKFQLLGKHSQVSCRTCHFTEKVPVVQKFKGLSQSCVTCHNDVHFNQFSINNQTDCTKCHTNNNWKPEKFNHNQSRFKLDGEHAGLDCKKCHKPSINTEVKYINYKFKDISCASCHL